MSFFVIPAVDLKGGKCVRLVQGDPRHQTVELDNPVEVAQGWQEMGARRLHLIDLDGALEGVRHNSGVTKDIVGALEIPVQFGGGIRSFEDACRLLDLGVEKIILGTAAMEDPALLDGLGEKYGRDRLIVALDSKGGRVVAVNFPVCFCLLIGIEGVVLGGTSPKSQVPSSKTQGQSQ